MHIGSGVRGRSCDISERFAYSPTGLSRAAVNGPADEVLREVNLVNLVLTTRPPLATRRNFRMMYGT